MTARPSEADIKLRIANVISDSEELMFERFDNLHKFQITDTDVVDYLRTEGMEAVARRYAEWQDLPVVFDEDNTTTSPVVPDPGDAPSYATLSEELDAAGINDQNLEQALIDAVSANRIDHGVFYAERSNDGVHWHVYKKRSHEDNGAFIATATSRLGAQFILNSLGTGTTASIGPEHPDHPDHEHTDCCK